MSCIRLHVERAGRLQAVSSEPPSASSEPSRVTFMWRLLAASVAGAGLDVFEDEPRVHPDLTGLKNCVLNPHLGSATEATRTEMGLLVMANLQAFFKGDPMPNAVA